MVASVVRHVWKASCDGIGAAEELNRGLQKVQ